MSRFFEGAFVVILITDIVVFIGYIFINPKGRIPRACPWVSRYYCLDNNSKDKIFDL